MPETLSAKQRGWLADGSELFRVLMSLSRACFISREQKQWHPDPVRCGHVYGTKFRSAGTREADERENGLAQPDLKAADLGMSMARAC